jgi:hypothetical protein
MKKLLSKIDIDKFSLSQMTSNKDGKTSGSGTMGCLIIAIGCICFAIGAIDFTLGSQQDDIMMYSSGIITVGAGLLGFRKSKEEDSQEPHI